MIHHHQLDQAAHTIPDAKDCQLLRWSLGLSFSKASTRNFYTAPDTGDVLLRCHALADAGFMLFYPSGEVPTQFYVTEAGAAAVGTSLNRDDAACMASLINDPAHADNTYSRWRSEVRRAHLDGSSPPHLLDFVATTHFYANIAKSHAMSA